MLLDSFGQRIHEVERETERMKAKRQRERKKKEWKKINREAKMNLAEICIGFVKSCHFPVTSRVAHLVFS